MSAAQAQPWPPARFPYLLLLSVLLHAALLLGWRGSRPATAPAAPARLIELQLLPLSRPPPAPLPRARERAVRMPAVPQAITIAPPAAPPAGDPVRQEPPVAAEVPAVELGSRARDMAAGIDRDLRTQTPPARKGAFSPKEGTRAERIEKAFADAGVPRGSTVTTVTTVERADGIRYTKVSGPGGAYCIYGRSGLPSAATLGTSLDRAYRSGNCPRD